VRPASLRGSSDSGPAAPGLAVNCTVLLLIAALIWWADRACKQWAVGQGPERHVLLPGVLSTTLAANTGATFGLFTGKALLLAGLSVLILAAIVVLWWFEGRTRAASSAAVGLLVGGALGNLYDRVALGFVVDFLRFDFLPWWPAFNVADAATVAGVALVALGLALPRPKQRALEGEP